MKFSTARRLCTAILCFGSLGVLATGRDNGNEDTYFHPRAHHVGTQLSPDQDGRPPPMVHSVSDLGTSRGLCASDSEHSPADSKTASVPGASPRSPHSPSAVPGVEPPAGVQTPFLHDQTPRPCVGREERGPCDHHPSLGSENNHQLNIPHPSEDIRVPKLPEERAMHPSQHQHGEQARAEEAARPPKQWSRATSTR